MSSRTGRGRPGRGQLLPALLVVLAASGLGHAAARAQGAGAVPPAVAAALGGAYGRYDPARRCWTASVANGASPTTGCLAVTRAEAVHTPAGERLFVLLGGTAQPACHACGGLIAFGVLDTGAAPRLLAHSRPIVDGAYGNPGDPKLMHLERLGADRWGWIQETGDVAQGVETAHYVVWLPREGRIEAAGILDGSHSNLGGLCSMVPRPAGLECSAVSVTYSVAASNAAAASYPIVLQASGRTNGRAVRAETLAVFDPGTLTYVQSGKLP